MPRSKDRLSAWKKVVPLMADGEHERLLDAALERAGEGGVFPPPKQVFRALELTPPKAVRVVVLGQDPYHGPGQAHGLAFSVPIGISPPPSLKNIFKELDGPGAEPRACGDLSPWAEQGVLLLNTVLTVEPASAGAHRGLGWEALTDAVVRAVSDKAEPSAFMLWGGQAQAKKNLIDQSRHLVLEAPHPSPLSAWRGFLGCGHFAKANEWLLSRNRQPVAW